MSTSERSGPTPTTWTIAKGVFLGLLLWTVVSSVLGVAFFALVFASASDDGGEGVLSLGDSIKDTTKETAAPSVVVGGTWTEVARLDGTAQKRGDVFALTGPARLRYGSDAKFFTVYVVKEGESLGEQGGFPEVSCNDPCNDQTNLAVGKGRYYLDVSASGGFTVTVEQQK